MATISRELESKNNDQSIAVGVMPPPAIGARRPLAPRPPAEPPQEDKNEEEEEEEGELEDEEDEESEARWYLVLGAGTTTRLQRFI